MIELDQFTNDRHVGSRFIRVLFKCVAIYIFCIDCYCTLYSLIQFCAMLVDSGIVELANIKRDYHRYFVLFCYFIAICL